jgi:hypothetical protein
MNNSLPSDAVSLKAAGHYNRLYLWFACLVAALGGLMFGYDWVVISGADIFYEKYFNLTAASDTGWAIRRYLRRGLCDHESEIARDQGQDSGTNRARTGGLNEPVLSRTETFQPCPIRPR